ncbi:MAG: hypothetical protein SFV54_13200 [Bryobacteraceae bacterium]|nr:hypothetical protein [Bryobacteraceae bacterium]
MRKIYLIEDDPFVIEWTERLVKKAFGDSLIVKTVSSERAFLVMQRFLVRSEVAGIIVDLLLPWEDGVPIQSDEYPTPRGDPFLAGLRVIGDLANDPSMRGAPVLLYTVNEPPEISEAVRSALQFSYMRKDEPDESLLVWIRKASLSRPS